MADAEDIQPLVVDNGTGMVKVCEFVMIEYSLPVDVCFLCSAGLFVLCSTSMKDSCFIYALTVLMMMYILLDVCRLVLLVMMLLGPCSPVLLGDLVTLV